MEENNKIELLSDKAISSASEDRFNRKPFVEAVADLIYSQSSKVNTEKVKEFKSVEENMTIGLFGPWGYGKSSVLNMLKEAVEKKGLITVYFNPWMYKNEEQLILSLFNVIAAKCELNNEDRNKLIKLFNKYYPLISLASPVVGETGKALIKIVGSDNENTDAAYCKNEIDKLLSATANPLTIFIDDVDRLSREEIHVLFKTIRLLASFKHVIYVVACDFEMVAKSIKENYADGSFEDGRAFIEKIIQIPLRIPEIKPGKLAEFAIEYVNQTCEINVASNILFSEIIQDSFNTPRDIKRFINGFRFTQKYLGDDIDANDLVILELIRVKLVDIFEIIRIYYRTIKTNTVTSDFQKKWVDYSKKKKLNFFDANDKLLPSSIELQQLKQIFNKLFNMDVVSANYFVVNGQQVYTTYKIGIQASANKTLHNPKVLIHYFEKIDSLQS